MNPRIKEIVAINPFIISTLWSNNEVREINFAQFLSDYFQKKDSIFYKILNEKTFLLAKTDGRTIYWDGLPEMQDVDGEIIAAPLDFCPDVLFEQSVLVQ